MSEARFVLAVLEMCKFWRVPIFLPSPRYTPCFNGFQSRIASFSEPDEDVDRQQIDDTIVDESSPARQY